MVTGFGFSTLKFFYLVFNIQEMDRFSYEASTSNIREVMKFYNPGNKSFETDFSTLVSSPS